MQIIICHLKISNINLETRQTLTGWERERWSTSQKILLVLLTTTNKEKKKKNQALRGNFITLFRAKYITHQFTLVSDITYKYQLILIFWSICNTYIKEYIKNLATFRFNIFFSKVWVNMIKYLFFVNTLTLNEKSFFLFFFFPLFAFNQRKRPKW